MTDQLDAQEQMDLAKRVDTTVADAQPSMEDAARLREELKASMLQTIGNMRKATVHVGSFGAQIGDGDSSAFVLREPIVSSKPAFEGAPEAVHHTYIVATTGGFRALEICSEPKNFNEQCLIKALDRAQGGKVPEKSTDMYKRGFSVDALGEGILTIPNPGDASRGEGNQEFSILFGRSVGCKFVEGVTPDQVNTALENSIAKAQEPHKQAINAAKTNLGIGANVQARLPQQK